MEDEAAERGHLLAGARNYTRSRAVGGSTESLLLSLSAGDGGSDNWQWEEPEMPVLLQVIYTDLDFLSAFHIQLHDLQHFLFEVCCRYNSQMVRTGGGKHLYLRGLYGRH